MTSACVFLGPTLVVDEAAAILDATYLPPVKLGDVHRVVSHLRPSAIGIVDGYFQWVPAVWHKEILWAIDQGVHVFGASSMGALRAAELAPFGMHGVGRIFEAYRDGRSPGLDDDPFEDDDEVAVVHGPSENGYRSASEAMVNIRCTLARAVEEGVMTGTTCRALAVRAKALFFPDRNYAALVAQGRADGLPELELTTFEHWLPSGRVDQKRLDATMMLEAMRGFLASPPPPARTDFAFERTVFWDRAEAAFRRQVGRRPRLSWKGCGSTPRNVSTSARTTSATGTSPAPESPSRRISTGGCTIPVTAIWASSTGTLSPHTCCRRPRPASAHERPGRRLPPERYPQRHPLPPLPAGAAPLHLVAARDRPGLAARRIDRPRAGRPPHVRGRRDREKPALRR